MSGSCRRFWCTLEKQKVDQTNKLEVECLCERMRVKFSMCIRIGEITIDHRTRTVNVVVVVVVLANVL